MRFSKRQRNFTSYCFLRLPCRCNIFVCQVFGTNSGKAAGLSGIFSPREVPRVPPQDSSIIQGTSCGKLFQTNLGLFHCLSDFGVQKPKRMQRRTCLRKILGQASDSPGETSWRNWLAVKPKYLQLNHGLWFLKPKVFPDKICLAKQRKLVKRGCRLEIIVDQYPCKSDLEPLF